MLSQIGVALRDSIVTIQDRDPQMGIRKHVGTGFNNSNLFTARRPSVGGTALRIQDFSFRIRRPSANPISKINEGRPSSHVSS